MRPTRIRDKKMLPFSNFGRVMEPETISKNGASLKSQMSRRKPKNLIFVTLIFAALLYSLNLRAQITLEHTFSTSQKSGLASAGIFYENINLYVVNTTNQIILYNTDYSLYKIVTPSLPTDYIIGSALLPSTAYSTNGKIGFVVYFYNQNIGNSSNLFIGSRIYDEDGGLLMDLGFCNRLDGVSIHKVNNNQYRLSIEKGMLGGNSYLHIAEIYSLPKAHDITVITYRVIVNGGSGSGYYVPGDIVTIQAGTPPDGQQFKNWTVISPAGATIADSTLEKITFIMPPTPVTITANFEATTTGTNILNTTSLLSYPNPAKTTINLPYRLKQGETSVMNIYNANGQLMETKKIDFVFDEIQLNVSGYTKGIYFYKVNGVSNKFIVN